MSSRSSTRKKEELAQKGKKKDMPSKASDDSEEEIDSDDEAEIVSLSAEEESSDEVKAPRKRGACSYNKAAFSMPDDISKLMNRVLCTACGKQLNPMNHGAVRKHPWLKVVTCKKCYKFLKSGPFTRDNEGIDEQCRWCGDGGRLYGCDFCHNCFCRSCIKRNLGRSEAAEMESETPKSQWKCYMCQPKKIKTLYDNCKKILDYIKKEEEKERQREERAKQREKEKAQAAKEKKLAAQNDKSDDKKDRRTSLPAPKLKLNFDNNKDKTQRTSLPAPAPQSQDCIVIGDSPEKPAFKHANAKSHLTGYNSRPGDGVTQVNKMGNGMTAVVVGPKAKMAVSMPYKDNIPLNKPPTLQPRPNLYGALTQQLQSTPSPSISQLASTMLTNKSISSLAKLNNIRAIKEQIVPFNVESITEKLSTVAQQLNLHLNSVKTDLAIAKLSSTDVYTSRSQAAFSVKNGLDTFFNNVRDIFNVQITMNPPEKNSPETAINIDDDTDVKKEESLPNGKATSDSAQKPSADIKDEKKDVKMEVDGDELEENTSLKDEIPKPSVKNEIKEESKTTDEDVMDTKTERINENNLESDEEEESENDKAEKKSKRSSKQSDKLDKSADDENAKSKSKKHGGESDKNENTAAELDFLKELADEINDSHEKDESSDEATEIRRSTRRGKSQPSKGNEDDKNAETETGTRKSSRNRASKDQPEKSKEDEDKNVKGKASESAEKDAKGKSKDTEEKDSKKESSKRSKSKDDGKESKSKDDGKDSKSKENKSKDSDEKTSSRKDKRRKNSKEDDASEEDDGRESRSKDDKENKSKDSNEKTSKSKDKRRKSSKEDDMSAEENDENPPSDDEDEDNEEENISSDSDSSVASIVFGKRTKKRKPREKADSQDDSKAGSKSKSRTKEKEKDKTGSSKKTDKKEKPSSKKAGSKAKITIESDEEEENHSDSSNYDSDLEKDIKSLSKDTRLQRRSTRAAAQKATEKVSEKKRDKKSAKSTKDGKDKSSTEDYDDLSSNSDDDSDPDDGNVDNEDGDDERDDEEGVEENLTPAQLRKLKANAKAKKEESDYEDMVASGPSDSDDPEVSFPKLSSPKKGKKKGKEESDDSDFVTPKKKKQKLKDKLLDEDLSGSDSDVVTKKKKKGRGRKRKKESEDEEPHPEDEIYSEDEKKKKGKGKRKRIRKIADSSEEEKEKKVEEEEGEEEDEDDDGHGGSHKRKKIRKVMANKKLADTTKEARKAEDERRKRIEERQKEFNAYVEVEGGEDEDELPEGTERETKDGETSDLAKILGSPKKVPITTKCVLDMEKESKKILIEIDKTLVRKLKPHQVEAVRFMYNCCVESIDRLHKEEGAGCILAHCMGLGKTLSVITFIHTMLKNFDKTKMRKCLVVCPLNTVLNWVNEFEIWLDDVDYEIDVYEMSKVKQNYERAQMLREWHEGKAGVMILGYDMYRNLVLGNHCKNKKQKATFYETLADPGPDMVVCDEGHVLKNDATSLSKAMAKIKSRRRIVLTGTPLQNNLGEYHCMVNFVKINLLGTRKEFNNRFANPITNGQCTDSSATDVKLMKRRAHILHEMLAGCVQRKDYSALTKFLPPKFEYVISVRMGTLQCKLYERYLEEAGVVQNEEIQGKNGRLFRDYQALMRIWTHPWVLKLDEIRQENKRTYDSEDSFIDDDDESEEDSFISNTTTSESDSDFEMKKKKSKGKRKKRGKANSSSSDSDVKEVNDENEVVKKWTSKRRGNEEGAGSSWMQDMGYATGPKEVSNEWWAEYVKEEDEFKIELSGKLKLLFEILKMCEDIGDKVLVFSQSLLSLDIIEDFLHYVDESNRDAREGEGGENKEETVNGVKENEDSGKQDSKTDDKKDDKADGKTEDKEDGEKKKDKYAEYGKSWTCGADYFRMDGSTNSQQRKAAQDSFNDPENYRARLFLISTKAGSLGINLVAANRVIIFDASWNPSHDIQSIFRVYRFGQVKPVYVYRFLAQGTMEEKIYERQVTKQSLSQRVVDEHQIERHFTAADLSELYKFQPDRLDDPNRKEQPLPMLPKDHMLAELMGTQKDWIVTFHEHDSLLENIVEQELSEEEKKAAWEDYENEKKGLNTAYPMYGNMLSAQQRMNNAMEFQNLVLQGQANLGQEVVLQIVQDLKTRFPTLPPEVFSQRVQAVLRQVLTQRIMQQTEFQRRQLDQQKMAELNRLNQIKQQIQQQQAMINNQQRGMGLGGFGSSSLFGVQALPSSGYFNSIQRSSGLGSSSNQQSSRSSAFGSGSSASSSNSKGDKK